MKPAIILALLLAAANAQAETHYIINNEMAQIKVMSGSCKAGRMLYASLRGPNRIFTTTLRLRPSNCNKDKQ